MSKFVLSILTVMLLFSSAVAQKDSTKKAQTDVYKELYDMQKTVRAKNDTIKSLKKKLATLENDLQNVKSELQNVKDENKTSIVKKNNEDLKRQLDDLQSYVSKLQSDSTSLANQLAQQKRESKDNSRRYEDTLKTLRAELQRIQPFKAMYLSQMVGSVDDEYLNKPFKDIDSVAFEKILSDFKMYSADDKRIAKAANQLENMKNDYFLYREGVAAVNAPYNAAIIKKIKDPLYELYKKTPQGDKKDDIYDIFWLVNNYESKIKVFQELIKIVNNRINANKNDAFAYADLELNNQEKNKKSITSIKEVPYLKKLYEQYYAALNKNCFGANPAKDEVLSLIP